MRQPTRRANVATRAVSPEHSSTFGRTSYVGGLGGSNSNNNNNNNSNRNWLLVLVVLILVPGNILVLWSSGGTYSF